MKRPENVLVTGGAGFVGSHAVEYYAERGATVTALDNRSRIATLEHADQSLDTTGYNWEYLEHEYPEVDLIKADVRDADRIESIVEGHDAVIHTAGQVAVTTSIDDPRTDFNVNALGTFNVLEATRKANSDPTVVITSTNKVYGDNVNEIPVVEGESHYRYDDPQFESGVPESFPIDQTEHTPYGVSKLAADLYAQDYALREEVDVAAFRMSCIYGPRQFGNEDQGWVAHFALSALRDEPLTIYGNGKQVRDVLYVRDLIRAFDAFISSPDEKPVVFNIGGGKENTTSLLEFLDLLERRVGGRPAVSYEGWREGDQYVYISDISRAQETLEWEPQVSLEQGIQQYLNWYKDARTTI